MSIKSITITYQDDTTETITPALPATPEAPVEVTLEVTPGETPTATISSTENAPVAPVDQPAPSTN